MDAFQVVSGGPASSEVLTLSQLATPMGSPLRGLAIESPINVAFDDRANRLLALGTARLFEVRLGPDRTLDPTTIASHDIRGLGLSDAQGLTVDPISGTVYILDAGRPAILWMQPRSDGSFGGSPSGEIDLRASGLRGLRGIAFDPTTGHLHVGSPLDRLVLELTATGDLLATRHLAAFRLGRPEAMVFAPSGDQTDSPDQLSLYVADSGDMGTATGDGDGTSPSAGQIVELSMVEPVAAAPSSFTSSLVRTTDLSAISPPSPDPSGVTYLPSSQRLVIVDGEVEETVGGITHFQGANVWETTLSGSVVRTANISKVAPTTTPMTDEPTGVTWNPGNGHYFISDDSGRRIYDLNPGGDGLIGTGDDTWTWFSTSTVGNGDPEGVTYDPLNNRLYVADGVNAEIYAYTPTGALIGQFDVAQYGVVDPESVEFNSANGSLFVLSNRSNPIIVETSTGGSLLQTIDVSASGALAPAGLAYAPASDGSGAKRFYVVDRAVDNDSDPRIVDGKLFELTAPSGTTASTPPTVSAGVDQTVTLPNVAALDGTVTDDGLPNPPGTVSTTWSQTSGPGTVTFGNPSAVDTTASLPISGVYVLRLTAFDGEWTSADEVTVTANGVGGVTVLDVRVAAGSDDAEESGSGSVSLTSTDLELVSDGSNQTVGMRFTGLQIPAGATVLHAYLQFQVDETNSEATALTIRGQASDNSPTFTSSSNNVSSRPKTAAGVAWAPPPWTTLGAAGADQRTPDLAAVVQEVVDRPGWVGGNALVLLVTGTGHRTAEAFEGTPSGAPLLHVEVSTTPVNTAPVVSAGQDQTVTLPAAAVLDGTVTDDGLPIPPGAVSVAWSQVSGPGTVTFANPAVVDTTAGFPTDGSYVLRLTADDGELSTSDEITITVNAIRDVVYVSSTSGGTVGGVTFADEDVLAYDWFTGTWSMYFDGSDVGLGSVDVDAFAVLVDGTLLLSVDSGLNLAGLGSVDDSDIVAFTPSSLGATTAGTFSFYLVGATVGLTTNNEDIDGIDFTQGGQLALSTIGNFSVTGAAGLDEDVFSGDVTGWSLYIQGGDVGLGDLGSEDVNGIWIDPTTDDIYLSVIGDFGVPGLSGTGADIFVCAPGSLGTTTTCTFRSYWTGSAYGFGSEVIDAIHIRR